jgi:hypothetical protein
LDQLVVNRLGFGILEASLAGIRRSYYSVTIIAKDRYPSVPSQDARGQDAGHFGRALLGRQKTPGGRNLGVGR